MLEVANVEHALFDVLSQFYSLRRFPTTGPPFRAGRAKQAITLTNPCIQI